MKDLSLCVHARVDLWMVGECWCAAACPPPPPPLRNCSKLTRRPPVSSLSDASSPDSSQTMVGPSSALSSVSVRCCAGSHCERHCSWRGAGRVSCSYGWRRWFRRRPSRTPTRVTSSRPTRTKPSQSPRIKDGKVNCLSLKFFFYNVYIAAS